MFGLFASKGPFDGRIASTGQSFRVAPKDSLLKAALEAGIAWPHSCRVGSCGTCRCRLLNGKIKPLNDFSYVLTEEEMDQGYILACQTVLRSDVEVEVRLDPAAAALSPAREVSGAIERSLSLTHDILEIGIRLDQPLPAYVAGQYAELAVPGVDKPRSYSFARAPEREDPGHATFHVRHVPGGRMSGWLHQQSRVGERVSLSGPHGTFGLRPEPAPMLCIAGGSGMAPIKALLESVAGRGFDRDVTYLFGARTRQDLYCLDEMREFAAAAGGRFRFIPVLSNEPADSDWAGERGMVTGMLRAPGLAAAGAEAYLCGPPPMIDAAIVELKGLGVPDARIHFDKFLDASHLPGGTR